jgi:hypothetical protein
MTPTSAIDRRAGRAAVAMLALLCLAAAPVGAQVASKADTASEASERGIPWIAHGSMDLFYLDSPAEDGTHPYQISSYAGITLQSLSFAWFHVGMRFRETMAPGFARPYREPALLKLMGTAEVLRDYAYAFIAGNVPLISNHVEAGDTAVLYRAVSDYDAFPYPNFTSPQGIHVGAFGRYRFQAWEAMLGGSYARSGRFEPVAGAAFFPSAYFDIFGRALLENKTARHRFDAKAVIYGEEGSGLRIPAHREGSLWQFRYGYLRFARGKSWQLGLGGAWKNPDRNREIRIESDLRPTLMNDNIQRAYGEFAVSFAPRPSWLMRAHLLPKALFVIDGGEFGHETEAGLSWATKVWGIHRLRLAGTGLYGSFRGQTYLGMGARLEFSFRHLGFQDLEDQGDQAEGER